MAKKKSNKKLEVQKTEFENIKNGYEEYKEQIDNDATFEEYVKLTNPPATIKKENTFFEIIKTNYYNNNFIVATLSNAIVSGILTAGFHVPLYFSLFCGMLTYYLLRINK